MSVLNCSYHVENSYAIFYPRASVLDICREIENGLSIRPEIAARLSGRLTVDYSCSYIMHRERTGIFVICGKAVITFLRFYSMHQRKMAVELFGEGDNPTSTLWKTEERVDEKVVENIIKEVTPKKEKVLYFQGILLNSILPDDKVCEALKVSKNQFRKMLVESEVLLDLANGFDFMVRIGEHHIGLRKSAGHLWFANLIK